MDSHRTLAFQEPDRVRHAQLWRNAQAHVKMIQARIAVQQLHTTLLTQLPQNPSKLPANDHNTPCDDALE
jgi:hypothetical protein